MTSGGYLLVAAAHSYIIESYQNSLSFNPLVILTIGTLILLYFAHMYGIRRQHLKYQQDGQFAAQDINLDN